MRLPATDVISIIVDHSNRKSLLSFMVRIRQHLSKALTFRFLAFRHRTGTGERGCAVRIFLNRAYLSPFKPLLCKGRLDDERSAREAMHGTRVRAGRDYRKDFP
jgi:hypothetical protein